MNPDDEPTLPAERFSRTLDWASPRSELAAELTQWGEFEIVGKLGQGGMGTVYKAWQPSLQRHVALKIVAGGASASRDAIIRFRVEAESVAQFQHPNVVQIFAVGDADGVPWCALEFVDGGTLADRLRRGGQPVAFDHVEAAEIVKCLAETIAGAHALGIIHRDLKPSNVLLTSNGIPKVADFGLAKWIHRDTTLSGSGVAVGTPSYMSPEQAQGDPAVGEAADIYSLGAILYELLTGRVPFVGANVFDVLLKLMNQPPVPPRHHMPTIPRPLETICLRCLEKNPKMRYPSAADLAADLQRFLNDEPIEAESANWLRRLQRWMRLRPALNVTWAALLFFYVNFVLMLATRAEVADGQFIGFATLITLAWGTSAALFQSLLFRYPQHPWIRYGWALCDVGWLTIFMFRGDGPSSTLLPSFHLLIAINTLRFRPRLTWAVTIGSIVSYVGIVADAAFRRPELSVPIRSSIIFVVSLFILGFSQVRVLRHFRSLIRT